MNFAVHKTAAVALAAVLLLNGCAAAIIGGAAAGTSSVLDRRSTGVQTDDQLLEMRIKNAAANRLEERNSLPGFTPDLSVVSYNRHVLLLGQVGTQADKDYVEEIAKSQQETQAVYNHIEVVPAVRRFSEIGADTWNTAKVRTALLGIQGVYPGRIKIVTYRNTTYVMGILTPAEQAAVTQRVATTTGVQKVVTLYQNYTPPAAGSETQ